MPRKSYKITIPDIEYYQSLFNCSYACPAGTKAGNYVTAIADGDYENAYTIASEPNPFAYVCGRVCAHPCETACRRGEIDKPVSIRALKRFATDNHDISLGHTPGAKPQPKNGKKVAIIGSGPAGLSAANSLAIMGYSVTVFEKSSEIGGMLYLGLPKYRLPRDVIKKEIDAILNLGVEVKTNTPIGKDLSLSDLKKEGFEAIFIGVGASNGRGLNIEGVKFDGVLNGVDFLLNVNLGYKVELGKKTIIIGGGNVAIDVARSVVREIQDVDKLSENEMKETLNTMQTVLHKLEQVEKKKKPNRDELTVALDVARSLMRVGGEGTDVKMICMESREEMPAHEEEIGEAIVEGITIMPSLGPQRIIGRDGKVTGLEVIEVESVFDESGRFNPSYRKGTNRVIEADSVILAIGQASDLTFITETDNIKTTRRGTVSVDEKTLATTAPGVFAGGDAAFGARLIIDAVGDGKKAAMSIHEYISENKEQGAVRTGNMKVISPYKMHDKYDLTPRKEPPALPANRRIGVAEVELCYSEQDARTEGERCLHCDVHTIFDSSKCILCGGCMDVCPEYCLKLVKLSELKHDDNDLDVLSEKKYEKSLSSMSEEDLENVGTAIIKDDDRCIRCGLCMKRCPVDAITMEKFELKS